MKICIGVDVGGSHVACWRFNEDYQALQECRKAVDAKGSARHIIDTWGSTIYSVCPPVSAKDIVLVGVAIPGPLDYEHGICTMTGVGKYESLFGMDLGLALRRVLRSRGVDADIIFVFSNDAECFLRGESWKAQLDNVVGITIGTGFGSAWKQHGECHEAGLYRFCIDDKGMDSLVSASALVRRCREQGVDVSDGKECGILASQNDAKVLSVLHAMGRDMGQAISSLDFVPSFVVIGGGVGGGCWKYLQPGVSSVLRDISIQPGTLGETAQMIGALLVAETALKECQPFRHSLVDIPGGGQGKQSDEQRRDQLAPWRCSQQFLLPPQPVPWQKGYELYPHHPIQHRVEYGWKALAELLERWEGVVVIEGVSNVFWFHLRDALDHQCSSPVWWWDASSCWHSSPVWDAKMEPFLGGNDPIFGKRCTLDLDKCVDLEKAVLLRQACVSVQGLSIVVGCGSSLLFPNAPCVYVEVPKNEMQFRARCRPSANLFSLPHFPPDPGFHPTVCTNHSRCKKTKKQVYKQMYFVDWPLVNALRQRIWSRILCVVDEQRVHEITFCESNRLRAALQGLSTFAVRPRPWFEPGVWGGQRIRKIIPALAQDVVNYAWSFEMIVRENGVILCGKDMVLEVPFEYLMNLHADNMLGKAQKQFGDDWPIRLDWLDTVDGGSLSVQCHPRSIEEYGEPYTQDESYYILDCKPPSVVHHTFQKGVSLAKFREALEFSQQHGTPVPISKEYVQTKPSERGDYFLMPSGTIHSSGSGNLVLEISATPYIFTLKVYDWCRLDLDGLPRPIKIDQAFQHLNIHAGHGAEVLDGAPHIVLQTNDVVVEEWNTPRLWWRVHRIHWVGSIHVVMNGSANALTVVDGSGATLVHGKHHREMHSFESIAIPAGCKEYTLITSTKTVVLVVSIKGEQKQQYST